MLLCRRARSPGSGWTLFSGVAASETRPEGGGWWGRASPLGVADSAALELIVVSSRCNLWHLSRSPGTARGGHGMKRFALIIAVGALLGALALPALAQQPPPGPTVRFSGEMRHIGVVQNNMNDFTDSDGTGLNRDSDSYYLSRFRLSTIMESGDKKARATWTLEVGDIEWGRRGGSSGDEYGCNGEAQGARRATSPCGIRPAPRSWGRTGCRSSRLSRRCPGPPVWAGAPAVVSEMTA